MDSSSHESQQAPSEEDMCIEEKPFWASVTNAAAIITMIVTAFIIGYYA